MMSQMNIINIILCASLLWPARFVHLIDRNELPRKVVSYYEPGTIEPEHLDTTTFTHLNYAFGILDETGRIRASDPERDEGADGYISRVTKLREQNTNLTILMAIGGWGDGSSKYSRMAAGEQTRTIFIESVIELLRKYDLDGLDFDWEFPVFPREIDNYQNQKSEVTGFSRPQIIDYNLADKHNFIILLRELRAAFEPYGYLLTAAVSARRHQIHVAYDIAALNDVVDWLNVMTYDFVEQSQRRTGHNSPLYHRNSSENNDNNNNNNCSKSIIRGATAQHAIEQWISGGAEPGKIVFGIPLYGYAFKLAKPATDYHLGALIDQRSPPVNITTTYGNLCKLIRKTGWRRFWDPNAAVPYATGPAGEWITYDDAQSVEAKLQFIDNYQLAGSMVWSVGLDDIRNHCGDGRFPLMKLQMRHLNGVTFSDVNEYELKSESVVDDDDEVYTYAANAQIYPRKSSPRF